MPKPKNITKDEKGKTYAWEAGDTFGIHKVSEKLAFFTNDFYEAFGNEEQKNFKFEFMSSIMEPTAIELEGLKRVAEVFGEFHGFDGQNGLMLTEAEHLIKYMNADEISAQKRYQKQNAKFMHGLTKAMREEKEPEKPKPIQNAEMSREELEKQNTSQENEYQKKVHIWNKKKKIADHIDRFMDLLDPEKGNYLKACVQNQYLLKFIGLNGSDPQFGTKGIDECITGLDQLDKPEKDRVPIFDVYMDLMDAGPVELEVEYHRQEMEKTGWDAEKEAVYLKELKEAHQFIIDKYDKLNQIEDSGQYDKYLNNKLQDATGKNGAQRDPTAEIGCLRGELQAMENGYASHELFILGELGGLEAEALKWQKYYHEQFPREQKVHEQKLEEINGNEKLSEQEKEESIEKENKSFQKQKDRLSQQDAYVKDIKALKDSVWEKKVSSPEEVLQVHYDIQDLVKNHPEMFHEQAVHRVCGDAMSLKVKEIESDAVHVELPGLDDFNKALDRFNTKRTGIRMSDESKLHKAVRERAEDLQKDLTALRSGLSAEGKVLTLEEKQKLLEGIEKKADDMDRAASTYLSERKGNRREAGNERKAGAKELRKAMDKMRGTLAREYEKTNKELGVDPKLENEIKEALDYSEDPAKPVEPKKKPAKKTGKTIGKGSKRTPAEEFKLQMEKDVKKLQNLSTLEFHDNSREMPGKNEWEYQFAKVLAERVVEMAVKKGQLTEDQAMRQIGSNVDNIMKRPGFDKLVKSTMGDVEKQKALTNKKPGEMLAEMFTVEKKMKQQEAAKEKQPNKRRMQRVNQTEKLQMQQGAKK